MLQTEKLPFLPYVRAGVGFLVVPVPLRVIGLLDSLATLRKLQR